MSDDVSCVPVAAVVPSSLAPVVSSMVGSKVHYFCADDELVVG